MRRGSIGLELFYRFEMRSANDMRWEFDCSGGVPMRFRGADHF
jgi:hypothetical protein